jgi:predicted ATP-binding protein involved in virulence
MSEKWFVVYKELALLLSRFYETNRNDPGRNFADLCARNSTFVNTNKWFKRATEGPGNYNIDPVQIFVSISDSSTGQSLRIKRINLLFKILESSMNFDDIDFSGCPTLFTIKVMARRPIEVQSAIWELMFTITTTGRQGLNKKVFEDVNGWYGINITSLTVFLFWIDAENFISMDQNTVTYLRFAGFIKRRPKNFDEYNQILNNKDIRDYPQISIEAKRNQALEITSETVPSSIKEIRVEKIDEILREDQKQQIAGCRILGVRIYKKTDIQWRKVLTDGKIYNFYSAFRFAEQLKTFRETNDNEIGYNAFKDIPFYQEGRLKVHISAIVGENGSGKSTLTELLFIIINNFTIKYSSIPNELIAVENIYADLFFITDALYKLSIQNDLYLLKKYARTEEGFKYSEEVTLLDFDFEQFFYSIITNYALYALNSIPLGDWVTKLFHKNDQYQAPIVITPFRKQGNININSENDLVTSRLVANLLLPVDKSKRKTDTIRKLTNSKLAEIFLIKLNENKFQYLYKIDDKVYSFSLVTNYWFKVLSEIKIAFEIKQPLPVTVPTEPNDYIEAGWMYLIKKIISICITYEAFTTYYSIDTNTFDIDRIEYLIEELRRQTSHVTHKFYQTIHFFNYQHLIEVRESKDTVLQVSCDINQLADKIQDIIIDLSDKRFKTIHFVPPAFLDIQIMLTKDVNFNELSSGEKQRIYSVSSVAYHLMNIDSNADQEDLVKYNGINILFDEVELYFHPEMQRTFIKFLLDYIQRLELEMIDSLNFIFVTHSPFILSDIPADNIIFLGATETDIKTFGSNIHTLLSESFFLKDSFMGEYAKETISDLINFLIGEKFNLKWDVNTSAQAIHVIGEPLLKSRLLEIYRKKYDAARQPIDMKLIALRKQIEILENEKNKK